MTDFQLSFCSFQQPITYKSNTLRQRVVYTSMTCN